MNWQAHNLSFAKQFDLFGGKIIFIDCKNCHWLKNHVLKWKRSYHSDNKRMFSCFPITNTQNSTSINLMISGPCNYIQVSSGCMTRVWMLLNSLYDRSHNKFTASSISWSQIASLLFFSLLSSVLLSLNVLCQKAMIYKLKMCPHSIETHITFSYNWT